MALSKVQAKVEGSVVSSPLSASEESREFFQSRLALFGKVGSLFILGYYLLTNLSLVLSGRDVVEVFFLDHGSQTSLVNAASTLVVWLVCRRGRISIPVLKFLDVWLVMFYCVLVAFNGWLARKDPFSIFVFMLPVTYAVLARSVIIPASPLRTAWISVTAYVPVFVVAYLVLGDPEVVWPEGADKPNLGVFVVRALIGAALAMVISTVIYGLRRQVRRATQLGQYKLEEKIGQGGMGEVYRASHAMLRRPTAIKLLRPEMAGERSLARFEREVQLTSQLTSPHTVAIYDYGRTPEGVFYYAMEYLEGIDLDQLVHLHGPQTPARVVHILKQVCYSLAEAHDTGMIHRDIKPANIILCQRGGMHDVAKVVDFGLVKSLETADAAVSGANQLTGTPLYMAPESIREPESITARADLYAVGAVGYFLLSGKPLFDSENFMEICSHQLHKIPERPSVRLGRALPEDLEGLIFMCLSKDPDDRPKSAAALAEALSHCADDGKWDREAADAWWQDHFKPTFRHFSDVVTRGVKVSASAPTLNVDLASRVDA